MITNEEYHADPAVSASHLHMVARSPYHYWARYINPDRITPEPTAAMRLGSLKGITPVSAGDMDAALAMASAVRSHQAAAALLRSGQPEQSFWWDDSDTGLRCKCRPDWLNGATVVDLKTTTDASPAGFAKSCAAFRYHVQASHYLAGLPAERFIFIAVEKTYPYAVGVYQLDADAMQRGDELRKQNMRMIADCRAINEWPGYSTTCESLSLPKWAFTTTHETLTSDDF
jgi:exodeoxyribonuclease VIII